jgi:hypothetical protein
MQQQETRQRLLGLSVQKMRETHLDQAIGLAIALHLYHPQDVEIALHLAHLFREKGEMARSERLLVQLSARFPHNKNIKASLALTYFHQENWQKAWQTFLVRFELMDKPPLVRLRGQEKPMWDGKTKPKRLLLLNEQGFGDSLQLARFIPFLTKQNIQTIFVAPKPLHHLFKNVAENVTIVAQEGSGQAEVDEWLPLMELPHVLGLEAKDYMATKPYLSFSKDKQNFWSEKLNKHKLNIGLVWQGNPAHSADKDRSLPLESFAPLAALSHVQLYSLQQGFGVEQIETCSFKDKLICFDLDKGEKAFEDTAALITNLDCVVSIDSAIAHLAGALHIPCHVLLMRLGADWRWLARQDTSVWYPHHKLYRQKRQGSWAEPIEKLKQQLLPFKTSPTLVPELLIGEGFEKSLRLAHLSSQSEDVGEIREFIHQRHALQDWLEVQNLSQEKQMRLKTAYQKQFALAQALKTQPNAQEYFNALEDYEALKNIL